MGNIFVSGYTEGALEGNTSEGGYDIFLTKWNADGTYGWIKQWGTASGEEGTAVAIGNSDNIFVAGYTGGDLDGNLQVGGGDIFLTEWLADGAKTWTKQWGTSLWDLSMDMEIDSLGDIFVVGYTLGGLDGNTNAGGNGDIYLTKWLTE